MGGGKEHKTTERDETNSVTWFALRRTIQLPCAGTDDELEVGNARFI